MEAAAELVVHAAVGHLAQRVRGHGQGSGVASALVLPQQKLQSHGLGEFWGPAEAALAIVVVLVELSEGRVEQVAIGARGDLVGHRQQD